MKSGWMILLGLLLAVNAFAAELTLDDVQAKWSEAADADARTVLAKKWVSNLNDIDVLRWVQDSWVQESPDLARSFFVNKANTNPKSAKYCYLAGRIAESTMEKIEAGRKTIELDPKFSYGYRLITSTYFTAFEQMSENPSDSLNIELMKDTAFFSKRTELEPRSDQAWQQYYVLLVFLKKYEEAERVLDKGLALKFKWANAEEQACLYLFMNRFEGALITVKDEASALLQAGKLTKEEVDPFVDERYIGALLQTKKIDRAITYINSKPNYNSSADLLYTLAALYAKSGKNDDVFRTLTQLEKAGGYRKELIEKDNDFAPLKKDSRWGVAVAALQASWNQDVLNRQAKVLTRMIDVPAPDFAIPDVNGDTVRLSQLKGTVILLDFWATWCGPCKMAMPVLDKYTKEKKPKGVRVFSINVWERETGKALPFMKEHGYAMELLFGNTELTKSYEVTGVPTLFVIDRNGKIRFKEIGYSDRLEEILPWWIEAASK